jgi:RNA 3'-terminal phosphate cyclase (ATP)
MIDRWPEFREHGESIDGGSYVTASHIAIDGSLGEGGGQILRSALALSVATGQPFRMFNIRAHRAKPGLMRQHLTALRATAEISDARVSGDELGSREIAFSPGAARAGNYHFKIGTAGGVMLVLQAVLPPLLRLPESSTVTVEGGTHNFAAPPFEFFERSLVPLLRQCGARVTARLERYGFFPAGGGRVVVEVEAAEQITPLVLREPGARLGISASVIVSQLPRDIAARELAVVAERLGLGAHECTELHATDALSPGNIVLVEIQSERVTEIVSAIGEQGVSAEAIGRRAADDAREYIAAARAVGPHLADQLMVPLALLAGGEYVTMPLTQHALTNLDTLRAFGVKAGVVEREGFVRVSAIGT